MHILEGKEEKMRGFKSCSSQRWANNSVFEYYSNTWGRILVFVFVFGWLFETEYYSYSYSGDFLKPNIIRIRIRVIFQTEYYSYSYSGDFLKPNNIRIRIRWEFFPNIFPEYFAEYWYFWWAKKNLKMPKSLPKKGKQRYPTGKCLNWNFHFFVWILLSSTRNKSKQPPCKS